MTYICAEIDCFAALAMTMLTLLAVWELIEPLFIVAAPLLTNRFTNPHNLHGIGTTVNILKVTFGDNYQITGSNFFAA